MERFKREMYEKKYREVEKQEKKKKRQEEKTKRKLENLKSPEAPHVPRKSDLMQHHHHHSHQYHHMRENDYDIEAKNRMQDQLACDTQTFVLNQLMLSIQFHGNYER